MYKLSLGKQPNSSTMFFQNIYQTRTIWFLKMKIIKYSIKKIFKINFKVKILKKYV